MIIFWIKEAFKSIGRAKSSFFLALISTSISVLLIAASVIIIQLTGRFQDSIKKSLNINIFLNENLTQKNINEIENEISGLHFVSGTKFISKDEAAEKFIAETGEDFRKILDYNPLPASFTVTLKSEYVENDSLKYILARLGDLSGVDEVVFQQEFAQKVISFLNSLKKYVFILTGILFIISLYIVYTTVKLITNSKRDELETMKLVGAKLSTIKMPIILNGTLIGLFAGLISLGIFILFIYYFDTYIGFQKIFPVNIRLYSLLLLGTGPLVGFFVSVFSLKNLTLKI